MNLHFSSRIRRVPRSFIREILEVAGAQGMISFAGGLPNPGLFPVDRFREAASKVLSGTGPSSLQYGASEGFLPLRQWICDRYKKRFGLSIEPENVLITTGSQQALDLAGKVFLGEEDAVVMERPGYLGGIQAFSLFTPHIVQVEQEEDGPDLQTLEGVLAAPNARLFYGIPNFQNPSGITWSREKREAVARLCASNDVLLLEDDPYGELRFEGEHLLPAVCHGQGEGVMLGTLSKVAAPGLRIGWMIASGEVMERLITAKQAADLHTSTLAQHIAMQFLSDNDLDRHISVIGKAYREQALEMVRMLEERFPEDVRFTRPQGGMFLWVTLPEGCSSMELFEKAIAKGVAFVPGEPFYVDGGGKNTMRLNFSNATAEEIREGMERLAGCLEEYMAR